MINQISAIKHSLSFAKRTGLRSMQNIKGIEREIIEAYRTELPHEIWGNPEKLIEWIKEKIELLINKDYPSDLLGKSITDSSRNDLVKAWGDLIKNDFKTAKNPFLQLKILKFVTGDLRKNNKSLAPVLRLDVFKEAISIITHTGESFKKIYTGLLKNTKYHNINVKEENLQLNNVRGTWYHVKTLNSSEAVKTPKLAKEINEFIMSISQGSNWCTRNKHNLEREYLGTNFHIFVDDKGIPQLCLVNDDNAGKIFRYIRGREQYKPLSDDYKQVLLNYLKKNNSCDAVLLDNEGFTNPVMKLLD